MGTEEKIVCNTDVKVDSGVGPIMGQTPLSRLSDPDSGMVNATIAESGAFQGPGRNEDSGMTCSHESKASTHSTSLEKTKTGQESLPPRGTDPTHSSCMMANGDRQDIPYRIMTHEKTDKIDMLTQMAPHLVRRRTTADTSVATIDPKTQLSPGSMRVTCSTMPEQGKGPQAERPTNSVCTIGCDAHPCAQHQNTNMSDQGAHTDSETVLWPPSLYPGETPSLHPVISERSLEKLRERSRMVDERLQDLQGELMGSVDRDLPPGCERPSISHLPAHNPYYCGVTPREALKDFPPPSPEISHSGVRYVSCVIHYEEDMPDEGCLNLDEGPTLESFFLVQTQYSAMRAEIPMANGSGGFLPQTVIVDSGAAHSCVDERL